MTATLTTSPTTVSTESPALWRTGLKAGVVAAAATTAIAAAASAAGVSFDASPGDAIPVLGFAQLTLLFTAVGVLIARAVRHRAEQPRSTFTKVTVGLTVLSVVPDLTMAFDVASKATLMLTHVVAAAIVIPALRDRLAAD